MLTRLRSFWHHVTDAPLAAAVAILAILSGVRVLVDPSSLPIQELIGWFAYVWATMYAIGGAFMLYGAGMRKPRWEAAGCALFAGGAFVEAVSFVQFIGLGFTTWFTIGTLLEFAYFAALRTKRLMQGKHLMWVDISKKVGLLTLPFLIAAAPSAGGVNIDLSAVLGIMGIVAAISTAVIAFRRSRPDSASVLVDASKDVVLIQKGAIDDLKKLVTDADDRLTEANARLRQVSNIEAEVAQLRKDLEVARSQITALSIENGKLRAELTAARARVTELERHNGS